MTSAAAKPPVGHFRPETPTAILSNSFALHNAAIASHELHGAIRLLGQDSRHRCRGRVHWPPVACDPPHGVSAGLQFVSHYARKCIRAYTLDELSSRTHSSRQAAESFHWLSDGWSKAVGFRRRH